VLGLGGGSILAGGGHQAPQIDRLDSLLAGSFSGLPQQGSFPLGRNVREHLWREIRFLGCFSPLSRQLVAGDAGQLSWREGRLMTRLVAQLSLSHLNESLATVDIIDVGVTRRIA